MFLTLVSQKLCCGQSYSRCDDTLNSENNMKRFRSVKLSKEWCTKQSMLLCNSIYLQYSKMYHDMYCNILQKDLNDLFSNFIDLRIDFFVEILWWIWYMWSSICRTQYRPEYMYGSLLLCGKKKIMPLCFRRSEKGFRALTLGHWPGSRTDTHSP